MIRTSAAISLSPKLLKPRLPVEACHGTYVFVALPKSSLRPSTEPGLHARVTPLVRFPTYESTSSSYASNAESQLREEIASYARLTYNWDGGGAKAPSKAVVKDALTFLDGRPSDIPLPHPEAGLDGDAGIYWDYSHANVFAEVTFEGDGTYAYFAVHGLPSAVANKCGSDCLKVTDPWPEDMLRILRARQSD